MGLPFWLLLTILIVLYLFLGCLMELVSMLVLTLPFVVPMMQAHGANLVWFGVIFVMLACIGGITPPFGLTIFVMKGTLGDEVELKDILPVPSLCDPSAFPHRHPLYISTDIFVAPERDVGEVGRQKE